MASNRKAQKETDKAIRHLMDYVDASSAWSSNYRDLEIQMVSPIANEFNLEVMDVLEKLFNSPYEETALGYLFEEMVTCNWDNNGSVIDEYLKKRGWREGPHGKRYLRALGESDTNLWITTDVAPGEWVDVQHYEKRSKPKRVYERSATQNMTVGQWLAARVLKIGKERCFSGAVIPLNDSQAERVIHAVGQLEESTQQVYQEMLKNKEIDHISEEVMNQEIKDSKVETLSNTAFALWAVAALNDEDTVAPQIRNTDDDEIVLTKHRLTIVGDTKTIQQKLDSTFENTGKNEWIWLNDRQRIMANIRLRKKFIELETNSVERGKNGIEKLQTLLGELVGKPIGVHETLDSAIANRPPVKPATRLSHEELQKQPELQAQIQDYLQKHYRESLDEPIPMLNNLSPRECAANSDTREKAITWLKNMELHNLKTGQIFDSTWMWEELKLTEYR